MRDNTAPDRRGGGLAPHQLDALERRADAADSRAGLLLGLSGLLASLGDGGGWLPLELSARFFAGVAALAAVSALSAEVVRPRSAARLAALAAEDPVLRAGAVQAESQSYDRDRASFESSWRVCASRRDWSPRRWRSRFSPLPSMAWPEQGGAMGKPDCQELCTEIHDGDTNETVKGKLVLRRVDAALVADGMPGLRAEDPAHRCPRSGYVLTRWDKIRDWLLGYR